MPDSIPLSEHEQLRLPEMGNQQIDRFQRIEVLSNIEGFLPTTKREQVEALSLQSFSSKRGGAAKHLAEIAIHQNKTNMEDPSRTTRSVTREYATWAFDAKASFDTLQTLDEAINEEINPELRLNRVFKPTQEGLLSFMRWYDLSQMRLDKGFNNIGYDPQKVEYTNSNGGIMFYLAEAMESWRVQQVRRKISLAQEHETQRFEFWTERLIEIEEHYPSLRNIAQEGLSKLYDSSSDKK